MVSSMEDKLKQMPKKIPFLLHLHCVIMLLLKQVLFEKFLLYL